MALSLVGGEGDLAFRAEVDRLAHEFKSRGLGIVGCYLTTDGTREFFYAGEVDPDASAGFLARVLAAMGDEVYE